MPVLADEIRFDADDLEEQQKALDKRRLKKLRRRLKALVVNMASRKGFNAKTNYVNLSNELRHQTFNETYADYGPEAKSFRTRTEFEGLLRIAGGDKKLLLSEYDRTLEAHPAFTLEATRYVWASSLKISSKTYDVIHTRRRRPVQELPLKEDNVLF